MPTRNQASFIRESVQSVLAQVADLPGTLELVVADGASTDGTIEILAEMAAVHPGLIHWVSEPDRGPADAVNKAVARSRADVVGWLNSDDLYTAGAAARALAVLRQQPTLAMVYGEGDHVDVGGAYLDRYPTRGPSTQLADWADGCHICQPTAFFRRSVFQALGGLDTRWRTAFDYDFWLRLLKTYPRQVGFVPQVQALSRLHDEGITLRSRELVAMEGLQVVRAHFGPTTAHWLLTHAQELLAEHPFGAAGRDPRAHLLTLADLAASCLLPGALADFERKLAGHRAMQLASDRFGISVQSDGWMLGEGQVRLLQGAPAVRLIRLHCRHASPVGGCLRVAVHTPEGEAIEYEWMRTGPFVLEIPVADQRAQAQLTFRVRSRDTFVPAALGRGSDDRRPLAFLVDNAEFV